MQSSPMKTVAAGILGVSLAAGISACGSSGKPASSATTNQSSNQPSASGTAGGSSSSVVSSAQAALTAHTSIPTFTAPGPSLKASSLQGKTVLVVAHDLVADELVGISQGIQQAGSAAGVKVQVFNGNGSVTTIQQGFNQGIQQHVGAIIVDGIASDLIQPSLQAATQAHIPVIAVENSKPATGAPGQGAGSGIYANAEPPDYTFGELIADDAIAATGGHVQAAVLTFNNPIAQAAVDGMHAALSACTTCKIVTTATIEPSSWPTNIAPQTESIVRANPNVNYILTAADTMGIFATSGIRQAGDAGKVSVLGVDGSGPATLALTKDGSVMKADPGSSPAWLGWAALDQAMRAMLHMAPADPTVPYRWIDSKALSGANTSDLSTVYGTSFVAGYKQLWGVSGS